MQQHNQMKMMKRKREDGSDESDTGSDVDGRMSSFGLGNANPPQRIAFIQSFIASLSDPNELDAAEKTLEAKRVSLGLLHVNDPNAPYLTDAAWLVLQQQFHSNGKIEEAKRRKMGGMKDVAAAAAAASSANQNGLDSSMIAGLTQMFAKHPDYLKEIQKNLGQ